ncbi:hypothetical protein N2M07_11025 [Escherichia coli]|uniref:ATP-binding protein n=1 Tax=Escherichia coli TaxID=562 RepID=UPI0022AE5ACA|nr:hypothetical protein [Escherichia coli]MCZ4163670.1 hypothetical protein [Escherichia coli]MCZ4175280.1 hypothetical protein [Escherichia coli]MCZ4180211.1 hypothetical protein [Escherichia coli]MCZ4195937.1 hypothetical protein [Escherichia coli]
MLRIRKILLRGNSVQDAYVDFYKGANILAGESDTGKSYLVSCLDYILGAEKLKKKLKEATDYTHLYVEFENDEGGVLTLKRGLEGGKLEAHDVAIQDIHGEGKIIAPVRKGTSKGPDVTSILFPFAGIKEFPKVLTISLHFRKFLVPFVDKIYYIHTVRTLKN